MSLTVDLVKSLAVKPSSHSKIQFEMLQALTLRDIVSWHMSP